MKQIFCTLDEILLTMRRNAGVSTTTAAAGASGAAAEGRRGSYYNAPNAALIGASHTETFLSAKADEKVCDSTLFYSILFYFFFY